MPPGIKVEDRLKSVALFRIKALSIHEHISILLQVSVGVLEYLIRVIVN